MNLVLLVPGKYPMDTSQVSSFTDVVKFFLIPELSKLFNCEIHWIPKPTDTTDLMQRIKSIDYTDVDAILALGVRYFSRVDQCVINELRSKTSATVCQLYDGSRLDMDPVDITFMMKHPEVLERHLERHCVGGNLYVGWAASAQFCYPEQDPTNLRILVDHPLYHNGVDHSIKIVESLGEWIAGGDWKESFKSVTVRQMVSGGVKTVDFNSSTVVKYDRSGLPYNDICREYRQCHIFCPTHPEGLGLTALETAMSGALVATHVGFIPEDRLKTIKHVTYYGEVDWNAVVKQINPMQSHQVAVENKWELVATNIWNHLNDRYS